MPPKHKRTHNSRPTKVADNSSKLNTGRRSTRASSGTKNAPAPEPILRATPQRLSQASLDTPFRQSTAGTIRTSSKSYRASYAAQKNKPSTAEPKSQKQNTMDIEIEHELRGAIFKDPKFIDHFLSGDDPKLDSVLQSCRENKSQFKRGKWSFPRLISHENKLYKPVLDVLNTIKNAVDQVHGPPLDLVPRSNNRPATVPIIDNHKYPISSDLANTENIKPDLVLFQDEQRHWENVRMPIEVKRLAQHHKGGIKQLCRYARAMFVHQLHRRHLYALLICGHHATFVRFDRAGVLYSGSINMVEQSDAFTRAFASLLMLDRVDEGLDPAFTFERNKAGRLTYYIDLPESELDRHSAGSLHSKNKGPISAIMDRLQRFKVIKLLCHRQCIRGRATIVLHIQEVLKFDQQAGANPGRKAKQKATKKVEPREYALKLMWRDAERTPEGDVLEEVHGMFGLPQHSGHWDVYIPGKCRCEKQAEGRCKEAKCVDTTVEVDGLEVCDRMQDIDILVLDEENGEEPEEVDTTEHHSTPFVRSLRIYSYALMLIVGVALCKAKFPEHFMTVILDAMIAGYWGMYNLGIIHRDVSDGNVMIVKKGQVFAERKWREQTELPVAPELADSEKKLRQVLQDLGRRDPMGLLSDFDLHARHSPPSGKANSGPLTPRKQNGKVIRPRDEDTANVSGRKRRKNNLGQGVHIKATSEKDGHQGKCIRNRVVDYRTGTPAFMATSVLSVQAGERYHHSFVYDLESFFWVIFWSVAAHLDKRGDNPTAGAQVVLNKMNRDEFSSIAEWKTTQLHYCAHNQSELIKILKGFGNGWGSSLIFQNVILGLGRFFFSALNPETCQKLETSPGTTFLAVVSIIQNALKGETDPEV
ncbi:other FunK1 protein kinase [Rhizoctonia solani]|uniref:Other FunK1 protein kinase n=1 Tax=Rhizoctonia solani TaxID=456999 RepID=A0A8H7HEY1_9AGAM|nr:other FunK1 protein kinase [Rhizoctonia solani]